MILVDSSIWIDHLRATNSELVRLLRAGAVLTHPFVIGELALGHLSRRKSFLVELMNLPSIVIAENTEVLRFIDDKRLFGTGLGYVDVHLLASSRLTAGSFLWTLDRRLETIAEKLAIAYKAR